VEASNLMSWLDFLLDNLSSMLIGNVLVSQGTNCVVYLPNFSLFSYEFDFLKCLLNNNTCPLMLHRFSLVRRSVDDFLFLIFQTLRILCTQTKTLLPMAYTQKHIVS